MGSIPRKIDSHCRAGNSVCLVDGAQALLSVLGRVSAGIGMQLGEGKREIVLDTGLR